MKPEWCPLWAMDAAWSVFGPPETVMRTPQRKVVVLSIARALLEAHKAGLMEGMEEAAKVADALSEQWAIEWRGTLKANDQLESMSDGADMAAAAIRAKAQEADQ